MRTERGFEFTSRLHKYDGRPFTREELVKDLKKLIRKI
jgi:hypothetical protein